MLLWSIWLRPAGLSAPSSGPTDRRSVDTGGHWNVAQNGLFPATSAAGVPLRHQGLGTPAEETKHTRSVRYQLMRPGRPRPQACRSGSSGPAQLQEGGAQNRTAICARPRTGTCPIPAVSRCWPGQAGRPARSWASPLRSLHIRPISTIRPRIEPSDALSVAPCGAGGGRGRIGGAEQFSADCPTASADASSFRRDLGVVLLMSSVTVLALAVKALWLTRVRERRFAGSTGPLRRLSSRG